MGRYDAIRESHCTKDGALCSSFGFNSFRQNAINLRAVAEERTNLLMPVHSRLDAMPMSQNKGTK